MPIRTTVDIPEPLHDRLRDRAERSGTSICRLIIRAIEQIYGEGKKGEYVQGPMVVGPGKLGPAFPKMRIPMTSFLPDLNAWLALSVGGHRHNAEAWNWLNLLPRDARLIFSRYTHAGLRRLLTNLSVMGEQARPVQRLAI